LLVDQRYREIVFSIMQTTELKDFVKEAIVQICGAVKEAGEEVKTMGAKVNPRPCGEGRELSQAQLIRTRGDSLMSFLDFDVAVTATHQEGKKAGIGVLFASIGGSMQEDRKKTAETISRLSFRIPISYPISH
jgi:hypothetical protein